MGIRYKRAANEIRKLLVEAPTDAPILRGSRSRRSMTREAQVSRTAKENSAGPMAATVL